MLGQTANSVFFSAALAVLALLGYGGTASAGYVPRNSRAAGDSLLTTESRAEFGAPGADFNYTATAAGSSESPFSYPDQPESPLADGKSLSTVLGILNGRGNSSSGAGATGHGQSHGGYGAPLAGAAIATAPSIQDEHDFVFEWDAEPPRSIASRLFRPPRLF